MKNTVHGMEPAPCDGPIAVAPARPVRVLITGGCGRIGLLLARELGAKYTFTLLDRVPPPPNALWPYIQADIADFEQLRGHFAGQDIVVHLAADPRPDAPWESLLPNNVAGTQHVFQAALDAGCRRVIFASSLYAVLGYPPDVLVHAEMPPNPSNLYGATKAWGEALGRFYAEHKGLSVLCVRIGWLKASRAVTLDNPRLDLIVTERDVVQLFDRCLSAPEHLKYAIIHGLSHHDSPRFDLQEAKTKIDYAPADDVSELARRNGRRLFWQWAGKWYRRLMKFLRRRARRSSAPTIEKN